MFNAMPIMAPIGGIAGSTKGPGFDSTPESPDEWLKRFRKQYEEYQAKQKGPLKIEDLSAYSLNQVQQSLDKYNDSQKPRETRGGGKDGRTYGGGNAWDMPVGFGGGGNPRKQYQRADYGIEDEFRYMVNELGFEGQRGGNGMGIGGNGEQAPPPPPGLKPGDKGYSYEPTNNYYGTNGSNGGPYGNKDGPLGFTDGDRAALAQKLGQGTQRQQYDYSGYDAATLSANTRASGQVTTGFYNKAYGQSPEEGTSRFGIADLEGNLGAGITATQLKDFFDGGGAGTLAADQQMGTGGIYDQVAAAAKAEEPVELESLPAPRPPGQMNIGPSMVGNSGNASGVRAKRSNSSRSGRNTRGTSQFNRNSFGNRRTSPLTIGGLNI